MQIFLIYPEIIILFIVFVAYCIILFSHYRGRSGKSKDIRLNIGCEYRSKTVNIKEGWVVASKIRTTTKNFPVSIYETTIPDSGVNKFHFTCQGCGRTGCVKIRSDQGALLVKTIQFILTVFVYLLGIGFILSPDLGGFEKFRGFFYVLILLAAWFWFKILMSPFGGQIVGAKIWEKAAEKKSGNLSFGDNMFGEHRLVRIERGTAETNRA